MISIVIFLIICLFLIWLLVMYKIWKKSAKETQGSLTEALTPSYSKGTRLLRRSWFVFLRFLQATRLGLEKIIARGFFAIFPNARKAFEKKDELTGLQKGPSSYFLMSISEEVTVNKTIKKARRKAKNV